ASPIPPLEQGGTIHPNADGRKCVEVRGGVLANGTPVQIYDCNRTAAQQWVFTRDQAGTPIRLANTNFCLDAGDNPFQPNGNQMKIWECYPELTQQRWSIDTDSTIKLSDVRYAQWGACLDITDGRLENTNVLQTWECSPSNINQLWQFQQPIVTHAQSGPQDPFYGWPLHPNNNTNKCLEVRGGVFTNGTPVQIYDCNGSEAQRWLYNWGPTINDLSLRLAHTDFCLDAGSNFLPQPNGNKLKIWACDSSLPQQRWIGIGTNTIKLADVQFGICLDLTEGILDNGNVVQTWECSANNANQVW
ncbi:carbohydrate-binding module family 13 protein/putative endo-1,3-beta-glucanase, partial [Coprinopsis sp. MPI-PUGE-AT-0042]